MIAQDITAMPNTAFGWYLTGLSDGEACFHFRHTNPVTRGTTRPQFQGLFGIAMRDDEAAGLSAIRDRMGVGRLYADLAASRTGKGNPQIKWEVCRVGELVSVIIPHFDRYPLRLKKARDYDVWRRCVMLWHASTLRKRVGKTPTETRFGLRGSRLTDQEVVLLLTWIAELKAGRKYAGSSLPE